MPRSYSEVGEDSTCVPDLEDGEVGGIEAFRVEAASAFVDIAKGLLSGAVWQDVTFEVHDEVGRDVLQAEISFPIDQLEPKSRLN